MHNFRQTLVIGSLTFRFGKVPRSRNSGSGNAPSDAHLPVRQTKGLQRLGSPTKERSG